MEGGVSSGEWRMVDKILTFNVLYLDCIVYLWPRQGRSRRMQGRWDRTSYIWKFEYLWCLPNLPDLNTINNFQQCRNLISFTFSLSCFN